MVSSNLRGVQKNVMMRESVFDPDAQAFKDLKNTKKRAHQWKLKSWKTPVWCFLCNKMCVDGGKFKGLQCKNCPCAAHKECSPRVPATCGLVAEESLLKHDRILLHELDKVSYCKVLNAEVKNRQRAEQLKENCTFFLFNDCVVCVEPLGDSFELLCMVKFYSRSTCRFAFVSNPHAEGRSFSISPARENEVHHKFLFVDSEAKNSMLEHVQTAMVDFRKQHEEAEKRRATRMRARFQ